jgi:hypothetical protein
VQDEKKKKEWEGRAMNRLEEANRTVNRVFKLDTAARIRKDVIKDFLEKGDKNYHRIFGAVTKFAKDVNKSLTKFKHALLPLASNLRALSSQKPESRVRYHELENSHHDTQARRRKGKAVNSGSNDDIASLSPEKKPVEKKKPMEETKPEKEKIPIPATVEVDLEMHEAQGVDVAPREDIRMEDSSPMSSRPVPSGPTSTASEEPPFTTEALALKDSEDGKL